MFSPQSNAVDHNVYDLQSEENVNKWRGLLKGPLQKVQRQVHPTLAAKEDALDYIEELIIKLVVMLCSSQPHTVSNVEERVSSTFPHPIDKWAIADAQNALDKGKKKSPLVLPVDKIHPLVKEVLGYKVETQVTMYIVAVLEYIAADILKLTGNYVKNIKHQEITCQDIKVAMCADKVLMDMFFQDDEVTLGVEEELPIKRRDSLVYEDIVKDLVLEETQYTRDLNMIIKVFRAPFAKLFPRSKDLEVIFSNIVDIAEFTANLLSSLEDALEMSDQSTSPCVGAVLEELAETAEFDVYEKYAEDMVKPNGRQRLNTLLLRGDASVTFQSAGHGFKDAVKYVLPKLLLGPIYHCLHYFEVIKVLADLSQNEEDKESLSQAYGLLHQLKGSLEHKLGPAAKRKPHDVSLRLQGRGDRQLALGKMSDLQKSIDGWEGKDIGKSCNKFIMEGTLSKYTGKRMTERYVFLFDGLIILTKQNTKRSSVTGPVGDYKLKEKFQIRKVDVADKEDSDDLKNAFELQIRDHPTVVLAAKTAEEKNNWMAAFVSLLTRSMLERMLDGCLVEEEKQQPLRIPSPENYRFAAEDSEENIVFEDNQDRVESPLIKGGTLLKLVERLTYHMYADPKFVRTFLTTFRSFCQPPELLELLIERFNIPDPPPLADAVNDADADPTNTIIRDDLKRFRLEYKKPIQIRVLNVLRHWVDQHFYDFEWHYELLQTLEEFLDTVKGKAMKKCVESIRKAIKRRKHSTSTERQIIHEKTPPRILWHITEKYDHFDLMTLHPIEIARQVTLLEFDLYRAVKPSELVGCVWNKKGKNVNSANLLKMIDFSTTFTFWLERLMIEAENFEERVAVMSRILEVMIVFVDLNNFSGVLEVVSALNSASVFRLRHTFDEVFSRNGKLMKAFEECKELNSDHFKHYIERLRSINPPCVPFLGMYLTNITHIEDGNPDFLPNRPEGIINFSKRRKVAEITQEIQQYQNQPYCLMTQPDIRRFFESLDARGDMNDKELNDYLYNKSTQLEPRNCKAPTKYERKRDYSFKSPGLKLLSTRHSTSTLGRSEKSHPTSLATTPSTPTFPHITEEGGGDLDSSCGATPPTPSTPITPPHETSDQSVFAPVMLPSSVTNSDTWSLSSGFSNFSQSTTVTLQSVAPVVVDKPPPLPPRVKKREPSLSGTGELSPVRQHPDAPLIPPRDGAPPLPPRRNDIQTLPRNAGRSPLALSSQTMPRRNSDRDPIPVNINGDRGGSTTPELPPKTYRGSHSRKQSS